MNHRGSFGRKVSSGLRQSDAQSPGAKTKDNKRSCLRFISSVRRSRCILCLAMFLCMILVQHYMRVIPRVLRRRRNRKIKLIVPFSTQGDNFITEFELTVHPLEDDNLNKARNESEWKWYCYSSQKSAATVPRVLLAQYAGHATPNAHYSSMLQSSSSVNRAYARQWGMDYVTLEGIALDDHHVIPSEYFLPRHSSYNKLELLRKALELSHQYDWLWILDSDALVYNLSTSFTSILPSNASNSVFLMAHRVHPEDSVHTFNINNGVLVMNLHHPMTPQVLSNWTRHSLNRIAANAQLRHIGSKQIVEGDDQTILHHILRNLDDTTGIHAMPHFQEKVVKHVVRSNHSVWDNHSQGREDALKLLASDVCHRYAPACDGINHEEYFQSTACPA